MAQSRESASNAMRCSQEAVDVPHSKMDGLLMSFAYYNEIDPFAAQWLRNLISAGHIVSVEEIAAAFGVSRQTITKIGRRRAWLHV